MESQASKRSKPTNDVQSYSSTSMQDSIPFLLQELITEILLRLSVKSLLKLRYVCEWEASLGYFYCWC
ncbi:hypothetical protein K7X08_033959 [Anisodus acutangulus]|uniref:F-box protein n=1 Tax=Anisodus acutangulus TaxID=402998 RepID=A0A9Q1MPT3_9SOLA|nr:hypothetical protein K7X08_033959 [Anisodus acutangulus]